MLQNYVEHNFCDNQSPLSLLRGRLTWILSWMSFSAIWIILKKFSFFFLWQVKNEKFHMEKNYELSQEILRWEVQKQSKSFELTEKVSV